MTWLRHDRADIYEIDVDATLPEISELFPAISYAEEEDTLELTSTYYDTAELDLLRQGITLRKRIGPIDAGWTLKVPAGQSRTEIAVPAGSPGVPKQLRDLSLGARRGHPLTRVAQVRIRRNVQRQFDADGRMLALVCDDTVHARSAVGPRTASEWREIDVKLGDSGTEELLASIGAGLVKAGARLAAWQSKLSRTLGSASRVGEPPHLARTRACAGSVAQRYLTEQYAAVVAGDVAVRGGEQDPRIMWAAARRIGNTLQSYRELFDEYRAAALETELDWLIDLLERVDEPLSLRRRLVTAVGELPREVVVGDVNAGIDEQLGNELAPRTRAMMKALRDKRYLSLLDNLSKWATAAPLAEVAAAPADTLAVYAEAAERAAREQLQRAVGSHGAQEDLRNLDKAVARVLDAAELAAGGRAGRAVKARGKRATQLHAQVGEYRNAVATAQFLRRVNDRTAVSNRKSGFTYGILFALEEIVARENLRAVLGNNL